MKNQGSAYLRQFNHVPREERKPRILNVTQQRIFDNARWYVYEMKVDPSLVESWVRIAVAAMANHENDNPYLQRLNREVRHV